MRTPITTASALVLTLAFAWPAGAQDAPQVDPRAEYLLGQMSQLLAAADGFILTADVTEDELTEWGQLIEARGTVQMSVRRPNRLSVDVRTTLTHEQFFYDGSQMTLFDVVLHAHASSDAPDTNDATIDAAMAEYGVAVPVADLAFSDPAASLLEHAVTGHYVGPVTAPQGATIDTLPDGYASLHVGQAQFFYFQGANYSEQSGHYVVVPPPVGAVVDYLPDSAQEQQADGQTVYNVDGDYYVARSQDGETVYELYSVSGG